LVKPSTLASSFNDFPFSILLLESTCGVTSGLGLVNAQPAVVNKILPKLRPAIPAQKPNQPRLWLACACQDVLCAGKGFFITVIHNGSGWFFCPQTGQILRTQNLKSKPQRRAALSSQTAAVARNGLTALAA
jgi:hypothetical protein